MSAPSKKPGSRESLRDVRMREWLPCLTAGLVSLAIRLVNLDSPLLNFRQTETAIIVQDWFRNGFTMLHYRIPVLGDYSQALFEFPLYEALVYFLSLLFGQSHMEIIGRLTNIFFFYLSAFILYKLSRLFTDRTASRSVLMFYLFSPFCVDHSRTFMIEYMAVFLSLLYLYAYLRCLKDPKLPALAVTLAAGALGYLCKSTTMFAPVIFIAVTVIHDVIAGLRAGRKLNPKTAAVFLSISVLPVIPGFIWTRFEDRVKAADPYTADFTSKALKAWNFGTLSQRLTPSNWISLMKYVNKGFTLMVIIGVIALILLRTRMTEKEKLYLLASALTSFFTVFILFHLYYMHEYYMSAVSPYICVLGGMTLFYFLSSALGNSLSRKAVPVILCVLIFLTYFINAGDNTVVNHHLSYLTGNDVKPDALNESQEIKRLTSESDRILISDEDWSPTTLYNASREGFMFHSSLKSDMEAIKETGQQDYTLYVCSGSSDHYPEVMRQMGASCQMFSGKCEGKRFIRIYESEKEAEESEGLSGYRVLEPDYGSGSSEDPYTGRSVVVSSAGKPLSARYIRIACSTPRDGDVVNVRLGNNAQDPGTREYSVDIGLAEGRNIYYAELPSGEGASSGMVRIEYPSDCGMEDMKLFCGDGD